jgi:hypothetical protein
VETDFPPPLTIGSRVWTESGYFDHGPMEGPKVNIAPRIGGVVVGSEKPYYTMDQLLYTVRWDNGQVSKHYLKELFCIGRFKTRAEFEAAIKFEGDIQLTVGPQGGFREALMCVNYDGATQQGRLTQQDRDSWVEFFQPLAMRQKANVQTTRLPPASRRKR